MLLPDIANMGANAVLAGTDWASRKLGGPQFPFRFPMASDALANTVARNAEKTGMTVFDPDTLPTKEKLAYNASRFGGQAALTAGLMAPLAVARNAGAPSKLPQIGDALLTPYANAPVKTAIGDTAAGVGGGTALTASQSMPTETRESIGPIAGTLLDLGAMLAGNIGGGTAAGVAMHGPSYLHDRARGSMVARDIRRDEDGIPTINRVADKAAEFVQGHSADPARAAEAIRRGAEEFRGMDAPIPASGALSNDPKLLALERGVRREEPGDFAVRDRELRDVAVEKLEGLKPAGAVPRDATDFAGQLVADKRAGANRALRTAEDDLSAAGESEQGVGSLFRSYGGRGSGASETLDRAVTEQSLRPMQREKNSRYDAIDPDRSVMRDVQPLVDLANKIERSVVEVPPALQREMIPQQLLADIKGMSQEAGGPGAMSFGAMNEMRSGLASASQAARRAGQHTLADNLDQFRSYIGEEGRTLASEGSTAGERARAANDYYSQDFAPVWNAGPGNAATTFRRDFNTDQRNRSLTPPTSTASRFLTAGPGAKEKAETLARVLDTIPAGADRDAATSAIRTYVLDDLSRTVTRDGKVDAQQLSRWLHGPSGWGDALSQFPTVRSEVEQLLTDVRAGRARSNEAAAMVERAAASVKRTDDEINNSALSLVVGREPTKAARAVLESRDPQKAMREVKEAIGGYAPAARGWERAVKDHLIDRVTSVDPAGVSGGERAINYGKLVRTLDRYDASLAELYAGQPEKMQALQQMRRILEPLAKQSGPSTTTYSLTASNEAFWKPVEIALKGIYGVLKGGGMIRTLKVASSFAWDDAQQAQRLVARMMLDPEARPALADAASCGSEHAGVERADREVAAARAGRT